MVIDDFFCLQTDFAEVLISNPDLHRYERKTDRVLLINIAPQITF